MVGKRKKNGQNILMCTRVPYSYYIYHYMLSKKTCKYQGLKQSAPFHLFFVSQGFSFGKSFLLICGECADICENGVAASFIKN